MCDGQCTTSGGAAGRYKKDISEEDKEAQRAENKTKNNPCLRIMEAQNRSAVTQFLPYSDQDFLKEDETPQLAWAPAPVATLIPEQSQPPVRQRVLQEGSMLDQENLPLKPNKATSQSKGLFKGAVKCLAEVSSRQVHPFIVGALLYEKLREVLVIGIRKVVDFFFFFF